MFAQKNIEKKCIATFLLLRRA